MVRPFVYITSVVIKNITHLLMFNLYTTSRNMHCGKINESRARTERESDSLFPMCLGLKVPKHQMQVRLEEAGRG